MLQQSTPRRPNARTFEGRQRQRIHALKRTLRYSESEYRTVPTVKNGVDFCRCVAVVELEHAA